MEDVRSLGSGILIERLEAACGEKAMLTLDNAPDDELRNAQRTVDMYSQEVQRRMSW